MSIYNVHIGQTCCLCVVLCQHFYVPLHILDAQRSCMNVPAFCVLLTVTAKLLLPAASLQARLQAISSLLQRLVASVVLRMQAATPSG